MGKSVRLSVSAASLAIALLPTTVLGFQVLPRISDVDRKLATWGDNEWTNGIGHWFIGNALPKIKSPVHEAITLNALSCDASTGSERTCVTVESVQQNQVLLYGARWPDDPPFALNRAAPPRISSCDPRVTLRSTAQPQCWKALFSDAEKTARQRAASNPDVAAFGPGDYLLYRSHFGDLQFFHSMATHDGEPAGETQARMRMWAEFLWGVATRTTPTDKFIRTLGVEPLAQYFPGDMTATNLLATGIVEVRKDLDQVAMGALLHMVQDSFSQAHTYRLSESGASCEEMPRFKQPGKIQQFFSYVRQVGSKHDHEDTFDALSIQTSTTSPNVVDVSRSFLTLWKEGAPWSEAGKYFDCVFVVEKADAPAGPGPYQE